MPELVEILLGSINSYQLISNAYLIKMVSIKLPHKYCKNYKIISNKLNTYKKSNPIMRTTQISKIVRLFSKKFGMTKQQILLYYNATQ
jgi:transcription-repair coupling factor (superfamily II helicase)